MRLGQISGGRWPGNRLIEWLSSAINSRAGGAGFSLQRGLQSPPCIGSLVASQGQATSREPHEPNPDSASPGPFSRRRYHITEAINGPDNHQPWPKDKAWLDR